MPKKTTQPTATNRDRVRDWIDKTRGTDSLRTAAQKSGTSDATLSIARTSGKLNPATAIDLARAYGQNPIQALIETGYLTPQEAQEAQEKLPTSPRDYSSTELLQELLRREEEAAETYGDQLNTIDEFTRRRLQVEALTESEIIELGAARHAPIEPQLGEDGYHDGP